MLQLGPSSDSDITCIWCEMTLPWFQDIIRSNSPQSWTRCSHATPARPSLHDGLAAQELTSRSHNTPWHVLAPALQVAQPSGPCSDLDQWPVPPTKKHICLSIKQHMQVPPQWNRHISRMRFPQVYVPVIYTTETKIFLNSNIIEKVYLVSCCGCHVLLANSHSFLLAACVDTFPIKILFHWVLHTNECTNYILYISLKLITLKHLKCSYMFRSLDHPQGARIVPC